MLRELRHYFASGLMAAGFVFVTVVGTLSTSGFCGHAPAIGFGCHAADREGDPDGNKHRPRP